MDTKKMAQIFAIQAEIEGMKIENAEFAANGKLPPYPYGEGAFFRKAEQLRALAVDGCQPEAKATKAFEKCGMKFYNEAILLNAIASASMRANGNMKSQKLVKVHQNILVFKKI